MSKKIAVITGSPRKNGNSFAMTDAFIKAAEAKGHSVTRFDAAMMKIGGCHACETCYSTGKACSFDDDFNLIAPVLLEADVTVFTMPVYWYSIPAQIKGVIDRIYSLVVGGKDIAGKECALIACCEEEDMTVLDGVRIPMERTAALNKWKMIGEVLIPGVLNAGDIEKTDGCRQAAELADRISAAGEEKAAAVNCRRSQAAQIKNERNENKNEQKNRNPQRKSPQKRKHIVSREVLHGRSGKCRPHGDGIFSSGYEYPRLPRMFRRTQQSGQSLCSERRYG